MFNYFIIGGLVGLAIGAIIFGFIKLVNDTKYDDMKSFYSDHLYKTKKDADFYRNKYFLTNGELSSCRKESEVREQILNKLLGEKHNYTDQVFMLEGDCYRPTDFTHRRDSDGMDTLDVSFVKMYDFKGEKGE